MRDETFMKLALELAEQGIGQTSPNPAVGAVVVKDGNVVGMGAHLKAGEAHAEVHAISMAGEKAKGAEIFVTLEPCSHYGKTPPCAELLIAAGIKRVVIAVLDPNPLVAGRGAALLEEAGIEVCTGVLEQEAAELNKFFFHYIKTGVPYVTLKAASTLDGKTATKSMDSKWITGEQAREDVHRYRERHDAILTGVNTVIHDNPSLTCRLEKPKRQPVRIILDRNLKTPLNSKVVTDGLAETWIVSSDDADPKRISDFEDLGVTIISLSAGHTLKDVLEELGKRGISSLLAEGGSQIHGSFIHEGCFNEMVIYIAPKLLGGKESLSISGGTGFERMKDAVELTFTEPVILGNDIKIRAVRRREEGK
ncbi:bifunctional diaminohydroxyphosphoribosylaminopyrimidine deaminase/5-amino-6-(5-phosphoribosylamino)uracil reductase RibD [Bacillus sp. FJAT-42376]|uniref:bifunctional diaminohydroxyphosphoribosylaminopyrimidine deaminase/5-amino-6-(5-phosphoribosylamino)uracil reductase RibD n=1 Tax=Bacillus sp. FJAT-42376 TaxID=2014076 RepID=UPI000F4E5DF6|nr:bifunctional diaminohydroxyphosphoribosylaminopyrimidine deaminase/5-amino-6-(5-phosphoribosylamino)uracil reductase RibD [Bacillus sp. FJAT-42376]AZB44882.1 bifunctional diaminohydroxyphosphoribosylaminopyrimidine deaminase/5-amino-6-(5-phosphoribosylamino)uracil reductase RibD [Bacillus sp. FJAT-42376]